MNNYLPLKKYLGFVAIAAVCCVTNLHGQTRVVPLIGQLAHRTPAGQAPVVTGNGIDYHGGPVMVNPHDVYFIWYGNWNGNSGLSILPSFITGLNGSSYFNTDTTYFNGNGQNIVNSVSMSGQVFDSYSQGTVLSDQALEAVVSRQLIAGALPTDPNGIYFVLTSADVDERGAVGEFCVNFCGFHDHAMLNGKDIKFSFVGNIARCPQACAAHNIGPGPNGNLGADAMANVMAHELNETVTDPDLNAWFDSTGQEVGDKCNFNFGPEFITANGAPADVTLGGRNFLIQQNWINANGGFCGMSIGSATATVTVDGFDQCTPDGSVCDTGLLSITVNGFTDSTPYNIGGVLPQFYASYLRNQINLDNPYVLATCPPAIGRQTCPSGTIILTSKIAGPNTDFPLSVSFSSNDPIDFPSPSYTLTASGPSLTGGH